MRNEVDRIDALLRTARLDAVWNRERGKLFDRVLAGRVVDVGRRESRGLQLALHLVHRCCRACKTVQQNDAFARRRERRAEAKECVQDQSLHAVSDLRQEAVFPQLPVVYPTKQQQRCCVCVRRIGVFSPSTLGRLQLPSGSLGRLPNLLNLAKLGMCAREQSEHIRGLQVCVGIRRRVLKLELEDPQGPVEALDGRLRDVLLAGDQASVRFVSSEANPSDLREVGSEGRMIIRSDNRMPIGWAVEEEYPEVREDLAPGDRIILYTDGVIEARNGEGRMFGEEGFHEFIRSGQDLEPGAFTEGILARVVEWTGGSDGKGLGDDLTVVALDLLR